MTPRDARTNPSGLPWGVIDERRMSGSKTDCIQRLEEVRWDVIRGMIRGVIAYAFRVLLKALMQ